MIDEKEFISKAYESANANIDGKKYISIDTLEKIIERTEKQYPFYLKDLRFKELKPGMIIHFETNIEQLALLIELDRFGYFWNGYGVRPLSHFLDDQKHYEYKKNRYIGLSEWKDGTKIIFAPEDSRIERYKAENGMEVVEISDLILHEDPEEPMISKEEVKHWFEFEISQAERNMKEVYNHMFNGVEVGHKKQIELNKAHIRFCRDAIRALCWRDK